MKKILCAAIHYNDGKVYPHQPKNIKEGLVICGRRHHNCITTLSSLTNGEHVRKFIDQGFLTVDDNYVDRQEAYKIAYEANQIIGPNKEREKNEIGLTSEDLY